MNAPPSIALTMMAARLAVARRRPQLGTDMLAANFLISTRVTGFEPVLRAHVGAVGREFYSILDRISAGEQP